MQTYAFLRVFPYICGRKRKTMEIKSAEFVISNTKVDLCPKGNLPEYAFIGRSNVGKSSLINMLTKKPKLAMTSATPGKTLLINHFLVNKEWYLVDLPGMVMPPVARSKWTRFRKSLKIMYWNVSR